MEAGEAEEEGRIVGGDGGEEAGDDGVDGLDVPIVCIWWSVGLGCWVDGCGIRRCGRLDWN